MKVIHKTVRVGSKPIHIIDTDETPGTSVVIQIGETKFYVSEAETGGLDILCSAGSMSIKPVVGNRIIVALDRADL